MENCLFSGWPQEEADCSQCDTAAPVLPWLPPPHASASFQFHGFPSWSVPVERISGEDDRSEERTATASKSHSQAEKRRRDRINAQLATLRKLIPKSEKVLLHLLLLLLLQPCLEFLVSVYACFERHLAWLCYGNIVDLCSTNNFTS